MTLFPNVNKTEHGKNYHFNKIYNHKEVICNHRHPEYGPIANIGCYADLAGNDPVVTGVLHEDLEDLGDDLGEVDLELCPQGGHYLLHQVNDGVLHGTVGAPVFLGRHRSKVII